MGPKTFTFVRFSDDFETLWQYLLNAKWHRQAGKGWKVRMVSYVVPKFHILWSTNGLKSDRSFTHPHYFVSSQSITHSLSSSSINVAPHSDCEWNSIVVYAILFATLATLKIFDWQWHWHWQHQVVCSSDSKSQKKDVTLEVLSRRAALSGNNRYNCHLF